VIIIEIELSFNIHSFSRLIKHIFFLKVTANITLRFNKFLRNVTSVGKYTYKILR